MKSKTELLYEILNSEPFFQWYCAEFVAHTEGGKGAPTREEIDTAIKRHFAPMYADPEAQPNEKPRVVKVTVKKATQKIVPIPATIISPEAPKTEASPVIAEPVSAA